MAERLGALFTNPVVLGSNPGSGLFFFFLLVQDKKPAVCTQPLKMVKRETWEGNFLLSLC